jgi:hypothetical protein
MVVFSPAYRDSPPLRESFPSSSLWCLPTVLVPYVTEIPPPPGYFIHPFLYFYFIGTICGSVVEPEPHGAGTFGGAGAGAEMSNFRLRLRVSLSSR